MSGPKPLRLETALLTAAALTASAFNSILTRLALGRGLINAAGFTTVRLTAGALALFGTVHPIKHEMRSHRFA